MIVFGLKAFLIINEKIHELLFRYYCSRLKLSVLDYSHLVHGCYFYRMFLTMMY